MTHIAWARQTPTDYDKHESLTSNTNCSYREQIVVFVVIDLFLM